MYCCNSNWKWRTPLARVMVYQAASMLTKTGEVKTPPFYGTREALKLLSLKPVESSGFEVEESELDENGLFQLKPNQ